MILVDANLLIYAVNADLPHHAAARSWLEQALGGSRTVGLPWVALLAFLRVCTNPRIFERPLSVTQAIDYLDQWMAQPSARPLAPGPRHWQILRELVVTNGTAGNLTTDAHLAALAIEHGCALYSADNDFKRFAGIRHINPLAA